MTDCPCGMRKPMIDCCGLFIVNGFPAPTAEALMRSRYTAYTLADTVYLQKTSSTGFFNDAATRKWSTQVTWLGLEVLSVTAGTQNDDTGEVTYIARYRENGQERNISEQALFGKINCEWRYIGPKAASSVQRPHRAGSSRNAPCPCGSGKKFKKCCAN